MRSAISIVIIILLFAAVAFVSAGIRQVLYGSAKTLADVPLARRRLGNRLAVACVGAIAVLFGCFWLQSYQASEPTGMVQLAASAVLLFVVLPGFVRGDR